MTAVTAQSPGDFTLGVEEEYQLVAPDTGELRSRARAVLETDWTGEIRPEMQQNMVEVGTRVCGSAEEARAEIARLRMQAAVAAEAGGLRVVAAGMHPFSDWSGQEFTRSATYDQIRRDYRRLASTQSIFGMHVHVALPQGRDRAVVMNTARWFLPHLLALSTSSPYFLSEDTGYASYRSILWRRWPRTGPPPRFESEAEYARLVSALIDTEMIDAPGRLYWDLRLHHQYPTLEFRVADVTPRVEDAVVVATLARAVVAGVVDGVIEEPRMPESHARVCLVENSWRASRDGLGAELADPFGGVLLVRGVRESLLDLAERLEPVAAALGDADALARLPAVLERGDAALRMRRWAAAHDGDLSGLVGWLADETLLGVGLDRRAEQREADAPS